MDIYSGHINKLIEQLSRLPGVGAKSAQRLAFHIINMPQEEVEKLTRTMLDAKANIRYCKECFTLTDKDLCPICANQARDHKTIMVVEHTRDMAAYEKTGKYEGVYHVLHGAISPMLGIGPGDLKIKELILRLEKDVTSSPLSIRIMENSLPIFCHNLINESVDPFPFNVGVVLNEPEYRSILGLKDLCKPTLDKA